ncbi:AMP-dependent synthetase/ligase [Dillenia turbinata]|uniref:AMP-dependent synthetase/ligase n=1 Tax=Dillenia turbinata TaxID=194707 RepID=A0AAN8UL90_9MAGN
MCGSSALPYPVMQQWETITGHCILERYGMTEFVMAISNPLRGALKGGTVGKPFLGVEAKILAEDGSDGGTEGVGELCIRNGGFFKTLDAVKVDEDGYYVILGRKSADIMKVGGYKLSALEIEAILLEASTTLPLAMSKCCVLGLPDKDYGEAVSAIIVPQADVKREGDENIKPAINFAIGPRTN